MSAAFRGRTAIESHDFLARFRLHCRFGRPLSSKVKIMATPTGEMRGGIQNLNLFRAIRTHEMCPLAACWTCYPRDLNMALAMTT